MKPVQFCSAGLEVIKLENRFKLKIKRYDWLLADTRPGINIVKTSPVYDRKLERSFVCFCLI